MNTYALAFALTFVLGGLALAVGPWWGLLVVGFAVGLMLRPGYPGALFWPGFLGGAALWALGALWFGLSAGGLPALIAELLGLGSETVLGVVIAVVGGLSAGLFAMLGSYLRAVVQGAPPADGEKVVRNARVGRPILPVEINRRVAARKDRLPRKPLVIIVFAVPERWGFCFGRNLPHDNQTT